MSEENKTEETSEVVESTETNEATETAEGELAAGDSPDFKWFIAKTLTGQEGKVQRALRERIVNYKQTEFFSEIMVPEETVTSHANGRKRTIKKKLFPGYVLIKMIMNDNTWHLVKDTDKITGFVGGTSDKPAPISDEEAAYMTGQQGEGFKKSKTTVDFAEGETVKVIEGPFASFVGTVEAISEKGKIRVNVSIFGRPTPVELDFTQIEKA
ncbi:putative transcription antitermination protein [Halobacteriovorax marinus SJ]|uniref:Transcription termination/antitermination protein NusG n=1 Tax=Halobacteriovorax marinus (strain ATCC BAA-682 / DSM 15412 / SJ) TaxID=862908 RepID=E1X0N5_HALMS|nr:transcription termination/antitermination protein NusG [Halobacteriovorax marinus]CBW28061.1 putative transcription antitermination protein [Halobacteriovorax marinus SJ]